MKLAEHSVVKVGRSQIVRKGDSYEWCTLAKLGRVQNFEAYKILN